MLRLINLGSGLWVDEIYSLLGSFRPPLLQIVGAFPRDNHHPFYSVLAHLSIALFGESAWSVRLPSVLFGTATVPLLYLLGTRLVNRREAFLAAAFLAVSYHHIWFSQNARGYAMLGCFAVLSAWLLIRVLEEGGPKFVIGYAVAMALGAWTHLTMIFVAVGHAAACALGFLITRQQRRTVAWRPVATAFVLAAVFTVLLYAPVLGDVATYFRDKPSGLRGISTPRWAALETVRVLAAGLGGGGVALALVVLTAGAVVFGAGLWSFWRRRPLALGMFVMPAFITLAGAAAARGTLYPRFFFSIAPYFVLVVVRGAFAAAGAMGRRLGDAAPDGPRATRLGTAAVAALILLSLVSLGRLYRYPKQDYLGARAWVEQQRRPGDAVATADVATAVYRDYLPTGWTPVTGAAQLDSLRAGRRVWLVYTFPRYLVRGAPEIFGVTERECRDARAFRGTVGGGDVYVCQLGPTP